MEWQIILAIAVAIPIILFPVAYVWYINIGGIVATIKDARARRVTQGKGSPEKEMEYNTALTKAIKRYPWHE
ncbi:hypothetical protein ES703_115661 [subsurface metagenome]